MGTSSAAVDRLLDPNNTSMTLITLSRVARLFGEKVCGEIGLRRETTLIFTPE
jgi:hypothetical protein